MGARLVIDSKEMLAKRFAETLKGRFAIALPGGSVAEAFLPVLAAAPVDWKGVDLYWGDERAVAPDDPESNFGLARRLLLDRVAGARVHRMRAEAGDLDAAAREYEKELVPLDVALLGVGPDGHVCSLFPGH